MGNFLTGQNMKAFSITAVLLYISKYINLDKLFLQLLAYVNTNDFVN